MPLIPRSIEINGRRWFRKGPGNTYHSVQIVVDGEVVHVVPYAYGYDRQYEETARAWLKREGYLPGIEDEPGRPGESLWRYCERVGCQYRDTVQDVSRKRDLHQELPDDEGRKTLRARAVARRVTAPHARCSPGRCVEHEYNSDVEPCA